MNGYFYVIKHISRKHFVSLQRYKIKERCKTRFPKRGEHKKMRIMKRMQMKFLCYSTKSNAIRQWVMEQCVKH